MMLVSIEVLRNDGLEKIVYPLPDVTLRNDVKTKLLLGIDRKHGPNGKVLFSLLFLSLSLPLFTSRISRWQVFHCSTITDIR
jgi:hypothetical protein